MKHRLAAPLSLRNCPSPSQGKSVSLNCYRFAIIAFTATLAIGHRADGQAVQRWPDQRVAGPYVIHADFKLSDVPGLVDELVKLQSDLSAQLQIGDPKERVYLFLFQKKSTYQKYVRKYFPEIPGRQALYIKKRGPGMVFAYMSDDFLIDLRHETTHALLHASLAMVPLWLDEGLAEYFEVTAANRAHSHRHLDPVKWKNRVGRLRNIEKLEEISDISRMGRGEYEEAWAWVHFMFHGDPAARAELLSYLGDIKQMNPPGKLSHRLRIRMANLDERFHSHVQSWPARPAIAEAGSVRR